MLNFHVALISVRLFHSRDLDGLKEGLVEAAKPSAQAPRGDLA